MSEKKQKRIKRHKKIRYRVNGTLQTPRLCIFRSINHIYGQLIDDDKNKTILSLSDKGMKSKADVKQEKTEGKLLSGKSALAFELGKAFAKKAKDLKVEKVVFDRAGFKYHGRIKAFADGAREGGLKF